MSTAGNGFKIWCDVCEDYTVIEKGIVYICECGNWRYSSS